MDQMSLLAILLALVVVSVSLLLIGARQRRDVSPDPRETPFAVSTEGMKRCANCGMGNLVTDATCSSCSRRLPDP